jgi:hypothetical protein
MVTRNFVAMYANIILLMVAKDVYMQVIFAFLAIMHGVLDYLEARRDFARREAALNELLKKYND